MKFNRPSMDDELEDSSVSTPAKLAATTAKERKFRRPRLAEIEGVGVKEPEPFTEGSTLKVGPFDTGMGIGKGTAQALAGAGARFNDLGLRAKQLAGAKGAQAEIDAQREQNRPLMDTTAGMLGYGMPDMAASLAVPFTRQASMLAGAASGAASPTVTSENSAQNLLLGALGGAGGYQLGKVMTGPPVKAYHAATKQFKNPEIRRLYDLAESYKVPASAGDLERAAGVPSVAAKIEDSILDSMPSGRAGFKDNQKAAMQDHLNRLLDQFNLGSGADEGTVMAQGVRDKFQQAKTQASKLFDKVDVAASQPGIAPIRPVELHNSATKALSEYPKLFDEFKDAGVLRKLLGLEEDAGPQAGLIINPKTNQPFKYDQELSFPDAQFLRKKLGNWTDQAEKKFRMGNMSGDEYRYVNQMFGAFNDDLNNWGSNSGNAALSDAWKSARDFYKTQVMPFKDPELLDSKTPLLRNIINDKVDTDVVPQQAFKTGREQLAQDLMDNMTPQGQQAAKSSLMRSIVEPGVNPDLESGLSTAAVLRHGAKYEDPSSAVFSTAEQRLLEDTRDLAHVARRSSSAGAGGPKTGYALMPWAAAGGIMGPAYMGLSAYREDLTPAERVALSMVLAPTLAIGGAKAVQAGLTSKLAQRVHFADPEADGLAGGLQQYSRRAIAGGGAPAQRLMTEYSLGSRPNDTEILVDDYEE